MDNNLALLQDLERREAERRRRAGLAAWGSVGLAALVLAILIGLGYSQLAKVRQAADKEAARVTNLQKLRATLEAQIASLQDDSKRLTEEKQHYRTLAGVKVVFYRAEDSDVIRSAFAKLGLDVELRAGVKTISKRADTLAFGPEVSESDCKAVAAALVTAGFPIRRIAPAQRITEARLLQIYASAKTQIDAPLYTVDRLQHEPVCRSGK
jgi:cell division protein FtsB